MVSDEARTGATGQGAGSGDGGSDRRRLSPQDELLEELVFKRDLNEIHLLIDFISGRPERTLEQLTMPDPRDPSKCLTSAQIVEGIAYMRYPPITDDRVMNARNAAFLLIAKDNLSALARPARALTIAYTEMFVGAEGESCFRAFRKRIAVWWQKLRGAAPRSSDATHGSNNVVAGETPHDQALLLDSRIVLATRTYPALKAHAEWFKNFRCWLLGFCILWFFLTAVAYWDVALGRSVLQRLDQFWKDRTAALVATPDLLDPAVCTPYVNGNQALPDLLNSAGAKKFAAACRSLHYLDRARFEAREDLTRAFRCSERTWSWWFHVWCWGSVLAGGVEPEGYWDKKYLGHRTQLLQSSPFPILETPEPHR